MAQDQTSTAESNRAIVAAAFDNWAHGRGNIFTELLAPDARWTIVGRSLASRTYESPAAFLEEVINPFNARLRSPLVPTVRGLFADGDTVVILFDGAAVARDGQPYHNTYAWFFKMRDGKVTEATAFFDSVEFNEFWYRVRPGE